MKFFDKCPSYAKLESLAKNPIDFTKQDVLTPSRIDKYLIKNEHLKLLYATERVDDLIINTLIEMSKETKALEKMIALQSGQIINKIENEESESRKVLHTATRDFFEDQNTSSEAKEARKLSYNEIEKLKVLLHEIDKKKKFKNIVQIGIGGSDLGPRAIYLALKAYSLPDRQAYFISNVDPDDASSVLENIDLSKTLFICVSKSGTTLETLANEELVRKKLKEAGLNPKDHFIAVTGKDSPMDDPSRYLASFYIWDYIGGRFSSTSMVGAVLLGFTIGFDNLMQFLKGANHMDKNALNKDVHKNFSLFSSLLNIWNRNFLDIPTVAVIPYSQALIRFTAHLQQCEMESNGKSICKNATFIDYKTSPVIWGEIGTNGQHSFFQCIHQGTDPISIEFIGFKNSQYNDDIIINNTTSQEKLLSNLFAQSIALAVGKEDKNPNKFFPGNRPNRILLSKVLDPFTMGKILAYYENKIAFEGFIWNINSFDQEGVQLGKKLANEILEIYASKRTNKKKSFPLGDTFLKHIR